MTIKFRESFLSTLVQADANFVVIGGIRGRHNDDRRCRHYTIFEFYSIGILPGNEKDIIQ